MEPEADQPEVLHRLAVEALAEGRDGAAANLLIRTLALAPNSVTALLNLGLAFRRLGLLEQAEAVYDQAITMAPGRVEAWAGRADLMLNEDRPDRALEDYDRALALDAGLARAWSNRALALLALDRPDTARESADRAVALDPGFVDALVVRGLAEREANRVDASVQSLDSAVRAQPDNAAAACNLGVSQLLAGDLPAGFRGHEARWRIEPGRSQQRGFGQPLWLGEGDIAGKALLFHAEQGFGDTIQFCRYAPLAKARGARVVLEVQPALKALMRSLDGVDVLAAAGDPLPPFDLHCPLMSLPLAFGTTLDTIPAANAYLAAPPDRLAAWAGLVPDSPKRKIGLAWFGKPTHKNDRNRSLQLDQLVRALPDSVELHSLHDRVREEDADALAAHPEIRRYEDQLADFADTAALAAQMDLVISVDTSTAHLAAATGRPTWVLLPFAPDWRWLTDRDDSPWYPSVRLFRQPAVGDWDSVMDRLGEALAGL